MSKVVEILLRITVCDDKFCGPYCVHDRGGLCVWPGGGPRSQELTGLPQPHIKLEWSNESPGGHLRHRACQEAAQKAKKLWEAQSRLIVLQTQKIG